MTSSSIVVRILIYYNFLFLNLSLKEMSETSRSVRCCLLGDVPGPRVSSRRIIVEYIPIYSESIRNRNTTRPGKHAAVSRGIVNGFLADGRTIRKFYANGSDVARACENPQSPQVRAVARRYFARNAILSSALR